MKKKMSIDEQLRELVREIVDEEIEARLGELNESRWITAKKAGEILGISGEAVGLRVRQGKLVGRLYGRRIYVDRIALDLAIADGRATLPRTQLGYDPEQKRSRGDG